MRTTGSVRILLAEDDHVHQTLLHRALTHGRPEVSAVLVGTGQAFLQAVRAQRFDCAVLDYNLPDYRADELLEAARDPLGDCPALVISASHDQRVVVASIRCGGIDFVSKDEAVQGDELWQRVEHAIEERRTRARDRRRTERRQRQLVGLVQRDPLTGLFNRRYVERCLKYNWWRNERRQGLGCTLLDIDHFKQVNDTHGHAAGDEVLRQVSAVVRRDAESGGAAIRWGGEELMVVKTSANLAETWLDAETMRQDVEQLHMEVGGKEVRVTVSIGVAQCQAAEFGHDVIEQADRALYLAKGLGRNAVCPHEMATVAQAMDQTLDDGVEGPEARRADLLRRLSGRLKPAQHQHTTHHCEQVSHAAARLARLLGVDADEADRVRVAGLFHDIGKCVIPEELLAKPGELDPREWWLMSRHVLYSQWIGQRLGLDARMLGYLRDHHRRFDDRRDTGASLGARILCTADALVTMVTDQGYRPARAYEAALLELRRGRGAQFDPELVEAAHAVATPELLLAA